MWQGARRWLSALEADPLVASRVLVWAWVLTRSLLVLALLVGRGYADPAFYSDAGQLALGRLPYRDVSVEYPPLAMLLILMPAIPLLPFPAWAPRPILDLHTSPFLPQPDPVRYRAYGISFGVEMLLLDALTLWLVRRAAMRLAPGDPTGLRSGLLYLVLMLASGALLQKFDLVMGTLCLLAVLALSERRVRLAGAAVALAVLTKGFPLLVVPALVVAQLAGAPARSLAQAVSARWAQLRDGVLAGAAVLAGATLLVVLFAGWEPVWHTLTYHTQRGTEIESLYGNVELALGWVPGLRATTVYSPADLSRIVRSPLDAAVGTATLLLTASLLALVYLALWRTLARGWRAATPVAHTGQLALAGSTAALLAFELGFRALPAHYVLVIVPLAAALRLPDPAYQRNFLASLIVITLGGQLVAVPAIWDALRHLAPWAVLLLSLRNIAWVVAFTTLVMASCLWAYDWYQTRAWEKLS